MRTQRGFTLIEVLVAITLLVIICSIVYASLVSVLNVTDLAREQTEKLHLRQFLTRSLTDSFTTVACDEALEDPQYLFQCLIDNQTKSTVIRFISSAPLMGNRGMPGALKQVQYTFSSMSNGFEGFSPNDTSQEQGGSLQATESLIETMSDGSVTSQTQGSQLFDDDKTKKKISDKQSTQKTTQKSTQQAQNTDQKEEKPSTSWSAPVKRIEVTFYDGKDKAWVNVWDTMDQGYLPWFVHIRIDLPSESQKEETTQADSKWENGADIDLFIPIPVGEGVTTDALIWTQGLDALIAQRDGATGQQPTVTPGKPVTGKDTAPKTSQTTGGG